LPETTEPEPTETETPETTEPETAETPSTPSAPMNDIYEPDNSFDQYSTMTITSEVQSQNRHIGPPSTDNYDYIRFYTDPGICTFNMTTSAYIGVFIYDTNENMLDFWYIGPKSLTIWSNSNQVEFSSSGYYFVEIEVTPSGGIEEGNYTLNFKYEPFPDPVLDGDSYEPDDDFAQFSSISVTEDAQLQYRTFTSSDDEDYIRFYAEAGLTYTFLTSSSVDTVGRLYDSNQNQLAYDDDSGPDENFMIEYEIAEAGYYFLQVKAYGVVNDNEPYGIHFVNQRISLYLAVAAQRIT
jgi:hypothetical protein